MRSTFWPNRIFEHQSSQNRHTGLKFSPKRGNSAFFMKIVQNPLFRSCRARFSQIVFVSVKVVKIVILASNSLQNGKIVRFSWKLYKTLFSRHAQHVLAKSNLWASKLSKSSYWPQILSKKAKQCAFHENCTKRLFQVSAARFRRIAFLSVKVLKIVKLAWNCPQNGKTVRFPWKLYKTLVSGHAQHVSAKSHFWASKFSKSGNSPQSLYKMEKQCAFLNNWTKRCFQVMRNTFWPNRLFEHQSSQNSHTGLKFSQKGCAFHENCTRRSFQVMRSTFLANRIFEHQKFLKSSNWPEIVLKTGKQCAFHENYTKRSI